MTPKYIDIHSHVNFKAFDTDRDAVIRRALDNDTWVINVGTQIDTSKKAIEMANEHDEGGLRYYWASSDTYGNFFS